jgi:hypothetical protein
MNDPQISDLLDQWRSGERARVIETLANSHPAITAVFIVQCSRDRSLNISDCNEITNLLLDANCRRVAALDDANARKTQGIDTVADLLLSLRTFKPADTIGIYNDEWLHSHIIKGVLPRAAVPGTNFDVLLGCS